MRKGKHESWETEKISLIPNPTRFIFSSIWNIFLIDLTILFLGITPIPFPFHILDSIVSCWIFHGGREINKIQKQWVTQIYLPSGFHQHQYNLRLLSINEGGKSLSSGDLNRSYMFLCWVINTGIIKHIGLVTSMTYGSGTTMPMFNIVLTNINSSKKHHLNLLLNHFKILGIKFNS